MELRVFTGQGGGKTNVINNFSGFMSPVVRQMLWRIMMTVGTKVWSVVEVDWLPVYG